MNNDKEFNSVKTDRTNLSEATQKLKTKRFNRINLMVYINFLLSQIVDKLYRDSEYESNPDFACFKKSIIYIIVKFKQDIEKSFLKLEPNVYCCKSFLESIGNFDSYTSAIEELVMYETLIENPLCFYHIFKRKNNSFGDQEMKMRTYINTYLCVRKVHVKLITYARYKKLFPFYNN